MIPWLILAACSAPSSTVPADCPCDRIVLPAAPVTTDGGLADLLVATAVAAYPNLAALNLVASPVANLQFFRSSIDLDSLDPNDDTTRVYRVDYDPVVLSDPPAPSALAAVLAHELGHIDDYTAMAAADYVSFGLWYGSAEGTDELATYERATDEQALSRGCATGLSAMRDWIYAHCSGDVLAEKQRDYYSPDEIAAWTAEDGACTVN